MTDRYERTRDPAEGRAITAIQVTLFGRECFLPADIAQEVEQACAAHGRTPMTTNTMGRDEAVECPECGRKWPWESEQAVAVGLQGACIACTMKYPDGTHEESQRRYSSIAALRDHDQEVRND